MPTRQRPATAANSARLTNPNDRPQRRSTETFGIAHALCGAVFLCPKRNGRGGSVTLCGEWVVRSAGVHRAACGHASGLRGRASALRGGAEVLGKGVSLCGGGSGSSAGNASHSLRACIGTAVAIESARRGRVAVRGREEVFGGECIAQSAGVRRRCVGERKSAGRE